MAAPLVLVVSDNATVTDELRYAFPPDVEIELANDSRDAWIFLLDRVPGAVVVDLQTGSSGGFGLARDMASDERLKDVPVVVLIDREQDAWLARQSGARLYRVKPAPGADLAEDVLHLMSADTGSPQPAG